MIESRVDLMTDDAVAGLKQAGCVEVWMGAEKRGARKCSMRWTRAHGSLRSTACPRLKQAGIKACFFIQFGYPGETFEDIMVTVHLVRETLPDNIGVSVSYPLPGTGFTRWSRSSSGEDQLGG